jgi:hypothetical protein
MNENNNLYSEASERRVESIYTAENKNNLKSDSEQEQYYLMLENKELKENHLKLSTKLEELKNKIKEKTTDVKINLFHDYNFKKFRKKNLNTKKLYMKKTMKLRILAMRYKKVNYFVFYFLFILFQ